MGLFKKLFGGERQPADEGIYLYVKLDRSDEIVRIRLEPRYELVPDDESGGYITRKSIVGPRSYRRAEAVFQFSPTRQLASWDIRGGTMSTGEEWQSQQQTDHPDG
nr:hypothetical protein [Anaerolineae bacterium]